MKVFVTLCLVVALAASASAHTYISHILVNGNTDVNTASQKYTLDSGWACRFDGPDQTFGPGGMTCTGPCDDVDYPWPIPNPPAKTTVARGAQLEVRWPRNNHPGGFIRLAWAPTADRYSHEAFDNGVMSVSCHETGNGCFSRGGPGLLDGDDNGSDGLVNPCIYSTTVPTWLPDGEFTLQWSWFGGGFTLGDYYSCSDFVIAGGPQAGNYPPGQGDINVNMDDINVGDGSGCRYFNTDELHVCVEEPCSRGQSKFQYADLRVGTPELSNYNNLAPGTPPATPAPPPVTTVELTSGVSQTNTLSKDDFQPYYIVVPGGSSRLVINVAPQGASDPDLFCSRNDANVGTTAGAATWAREEGGGTTEVLDLTNPSPGTYYCNVLGWTDTTYDITAVVTGPTTVPCSNDCSGHGTCNTNNGQCSCQTDWGPAGDGDCNTYTDPNGGNNGVTVLSSGQSVSGDVGLKAYDQYSYDVQTAGSTVTFTLEPGSADVDIYVSRVPEPSSKQSEWSSTRGGTQVDEIERTGNVVVAATYYIAVHGWEASDYELTVTEEGAKVTENAYPTLSDGIGLDANVGLRDYNFYNIDLGADQAATLTLVSTTGDADVYCKREGEGVPSTFDSTFKSEDYRRVESMEISGSSNFVCGIYGYAASSDYTVKYETNNIRQACAGVGGCMGGDCTPGSGMSDGECDCWDEWSTASCAFMSSEIDVEQYACPSSKSGDGVTHSTAVPAGETLTHVITVEEDERITFSGVSDLPLTLYAKKDACPTATDYDFTVTTFGSDNDYSIETGCDNEAHMTAGNWYVMAEQAQGGESKMQGKGSVSSCKSTLSFILIGAGAIVAIAIIGIIIAAVFIIRKKKNGSRY